MDDSIKKVIHDKLTPLSIREINEMLQQLRPPVRSINHKNNFNQSRKEIIHAVSLQVKEATNQMKEIFDIVRDQHKIPFHDIQSEIIPVIQQAAEIPHIYHLFFELHSKDEYTCRHTICVGIIATMLGKWLKLKEEDLHQLTLAATLHDIGKTRVPSKVLNKPGKLTPEEYDEMKRHTLYGYDLLKNNSQLDERIAIVALQHHEREDGKGYPFKLTSNQINSFTKIVSIADVFHAMSSKRVYQEALPFYEVMKQMQTAMFGQFDSRMMHLFMDKMMNMLVGKQVLLTNGEVGTIVMIHPYNPLKSIVRINSDLIDLQYANNLNIERVIDL